MNRQPLRQPSPGIFIGLALRCRGSRDCRGAGASGCCGGRVPLRLRLLLGRGGVPLLLPLTTLRLLRLLLRRVLLWLSPSSIPVSGRRLLPLRRALLLLGPLLRTRDLPLRTAAQRVPGGVEVLDLGLLVAVPGRAQLALPGCGLRPAPAAPAAAGAPAASRRSGRRRRGAAVRRGSAAPGHAGGAGVRQDAGRAVRVVGPRGAVRQHLRGVGRAGHARHRGRRRVGARAARPRPPRLAICAELALYTDALGDGAQPAGEVLGAGPLIRVLAQGSAYDGPQGVRDRGGAARLGAQVLVQHFEGGLAGEWDGR